MNLNDTIERLRVARFCYAHNIEFMSDYEYDKLYEEYSIATGVLNIFNYVNEEEIIPEDILNKYGIDFKYTTNIFSNDKTEKNILTEKGRNLINTDNISILPLKYEQEVVQKIKELNYGEYVVSPKIDGIFVSALLERTSGDNYQLSYGKTRGSENESYDVTSILSRLIPSEYIIQDCKEDAIKITFEAIYKKDKLVYSGYKSQRSAANAILSSTVNEKQSLIGNLDLYAHSCSLDMERDEQLKFLSKIGITTVPFLNLIIYPEYDIFNQFVDTITIVDNWSIDKGLDIDGIVCVRKNFEGDLDKEGYKIYSTNIFAIKVGYWDKEIFTTEVVKIQAEQQDYEISFKIVVNPVVARNGNTIQNITNINLEVLIRDDIDIGDLIEIQYLNSTTPKYRGKVNGRV